MYQTAQILDLYDMLMVSLGVGPCAWSVKGLFWVRGLRFGLIVAIAGLVVRKERSRGWHYTH